MATERLNGREISRKTTGQLVGQTERQIDRQKRKAYKDRKMYAQTERKTYKNRRIGLPTERQTDGETTDR